MYRITRSISFVGLGLVALLAGSPLSAEVRSPAEVVREVRQGVVHIRAQHPALNASVFSGSGFVYDEEGTIITNNHVISDNHGDPFEKICVDFADGVSADATLVGRDVYTDLAVLRVKDLQGVTLHPLRLARYQDIEVGTEVLAIGFPLELGSSQTVSRGIVSARDREQIEGVSSQEGWVAIGGMIQTDAVINHGNSGGPLVNFDGEVLGVTTLSLSSIVVMSETGEPEKEPVQGIFFCIGASLRPVVEAILKDGRVRRGYLGIRAQTSQGKPLTVASGNWRWRDGVSVVEVLKDTPACKTPLRDLATLPSSDGPPRTFPFPTAKITRVGDWPIVSTGDLVNALARYGAGEEVTVEFVVESLMAEKASAVPEKATVKVTLEERPETAGPEEW